MPADEEKEVQAEAQEQTGGEQQAPEQAMDFADMDLSVESVEERISPSETNVFDK